MAARFLGHGDCQYPILSNPPENGSRGTIRDRFPAISGRPSAGTGRRGLDGAIVASAGADCLYGYLAHHRLHISR